MLLDTHAWLWFVLGDAQLSRAARAAIEDSADEKLGSPASYWELAVEIGIGKYALPQPYETFMAHAVGGQGFVVLPVLPKHTAVLCSLAFHHRDPFDRILVAQAMAEQVPLISTDRTLDAYPVRRIW